MCLAVPMEVIAIDGRHARVRAESVELTASLDLVEEARVGDYVIVHAGFAIQKLDADEARESLAMLQKLSELRAEP
jgi:hydrogenase expression/formation protein HypC